MQYTPPMNTSGSRILEEALKVNPLSTLRKLHTPPNVNQSKLSSQLKHNTKECMALRYKIENLVQARHLRYYIQRTMKNVLGLHERITRAKRTPNLLR